MHFPGLLSMSSAFPGSASAPFYYLLVEDPHTAELASSPPRWGRPLEQVSAAGGFQMTGWQQLAHVLVHRLATHPARLANASAASCCVVASPSGSPTECAARGSRVAARLRALGRRICPGRPIVVIDGPDADGTKDAVCTALWSPPRTSGCARGLDDPLVRVTGNAPGLQSEVAGPGTRGLCRRLAPTPYLAHARSPLAAAAGARRPLRVAYAAASWGHIDAEKHGFVAWRKALRNACKSARHANGSGACEWAWVSMSGNGAEDRTPTP